jgi:hypothetical protein
LKASANIEKAMLWFREDLDALKQIFVDGCPISKARYMIYAPILAAIASTTAISVKKNYLDLDESKLTK